MEDVLWYRKPLLSEPVAVLAFEGWSDAGNTASGCVENLSGTFDIEPFAELNSDAFRINTAPAKLIINVINVSDKFNIECFSLLY